MLWKWNLGKIFCLLSIESYISKFSEFFPNFESNCYTTLKTKHCEYLSNSNENEHKSIFEFIFFLRNRSQTSKRVSSNKAVIVNGTFCLFIIFLEIILQQNLINWDWWYTFSDTKQTVYNAKMFLYLQLAFRN